LAVLVFFIHFEKMADLLGAIPPHPRMRNQRIFPVLPDPDLVIARTKRVVGRFREVVHVWEFRAGVETSGGWWLK